MLKTVFANISLRGLTLASRFLLVITLAKLFSQATLGIFGLMTVTVQAGALLLGLDFYTFATREILAADRDGRRRHLRDQLVFFVFSYAVGLPILGLTFVFDVIPIDVIGWFYAILVLEHLSLECYRLLVVMERPLVASTVLFFRSAAWVYAVLGAMLFWPATRTLETVWIGWVAGGTVSLGLSLFALRGLFHGGWPGAVDWGWIRSGFKVASHFLTSTLCLRAITVADRYVLKIVVGIEVVGIYTFFFSIANAILVFVDASVVALLYPRIVAKYQDGEIAEYKKLFRAFAIRATAATLGISIVAAMFITPVTKAMDKAPFLAEIRVFWVLLAAIGVSALSLIPHYGLFAQKRDRAILASSVAGLVAALVVLPLAIAKFGVTGAALGVFAGMAVMAVAKWIALKAVAPGAAAPKDVA